MSKIITSNQILGEIGETAAKKRFLSMGFQFDGRSRLEAGVDGIVEVMDNGRPLARMIAVQVKARHSNRYTGETDDGFTYLLRKDDLAYWSGSNLPVIIVLYRESDNTFYWKSVGPASAQQDRRLTFDKKRDRLDDEAKDRLADLTVHATGFGHYIPPLGGGEEALVNVLPVHPPDEMFVASTSLSVDAAITALLNADQSARFDWVISNRSFWSFHDPRESVCREIVDLDQVEGIDTFRLSEHDDVQERNNFSFLLRKALEHQFRDELRWSKDNRALYFAAPDANTSKTFSYASTKKRTSAEVVNVSIDKVEKSVNFVRHHAFAPRFELIGDQWVMIITPTYVFTQDGFRPLQNPAPLLSGKKRMDNSASLRGQVIMWHRFLTQDDELPDDEDFFEQLSSEREPSLRFGAPPTVELASRVPEDVWGSKRSKVQPAADDADVETGLFA
ncbi:MAG: DUF4365 domain-containing protein [Pseudomonadota bacterium]